MGYKFTCAAPWIIAAQLSFSLSDLIFLLIRIKSYTHVCSAHRGEEPRKIKTQQPLYKKSNTIYCVGCNHQATAVQRNKTALK